MNIFWKKNEGYSREYNFPNQFPISTADLNQQICMTQYHVKTTVVLLSPIWLYVFTYTLQISKDSK